MNWESIIAWLPGLASLIGSGPWGIVGILGALGVVGGLIYFGIRYANKARDASDLESGGADASRTAIDLRKQSDANNDFVNKEREELLKQGPPKE